MHIKPFLKLLKLKGVAVSLISSPGAYERVLHDELDLNIIPLTINREINVLGDLYSLICLILIFRKNKFSIIHSSTPKAGLLVAIAGLFSPNSVRIHTFTGQRWANMKGLMRQFLKGFE